MMNEQARRSVLVMDVVESVRLIGQDERDVVRRWLRLVEHVKSLLPAEAEGRLVKSLGDGMLLEFARPQTALRVAFATMAFSREANRGIPVERQILLRMGVEIADVIVGDDDIYGHGVNMAARLATLAKPGEIVVSAQIRDEVTPDLDADVEDLGECFLKHIPEPVRAYRVGPPGELRLAPSLDTLASMLPTVAVVPFRTHGGPVLGEVLAAEVIRTLSQSDRVNVISRLSTQAFRGTERSAKEIGALLKANYVVSGNCIDVDGTATVALEMAEARTDAVIWAERFRAKVGDILLGDQELVTAIVGAMGQAILKREFDRARTLPLPTIESYGLLLGAITSMYRLSRSEFERAGDMLEHLIDREPRQPLPLAWMGNWHVLKVQQGWTDNAATERRLAQARTARALDLDGENAQALTIDGFVQTNLLRDFDTAEDRYRRALISNPNAGMAWLLKGMMHAFRGEGDDAVDHTERALMLSPIDPQRFFYDGLAGGAYIAAERFDLAEAATLRSLKANATHTSTLRMLAVAQWELKKYDQARQTVTKLTLLDPNFTITRWLRENPSANYQQGARIAEILRAAGAPE